MTAIAIVAFGAISGLGEKDAATSAGTPGQPARQAVRLDDELSRAGLARPFAARAAVPIGGDRVTGLLSTALLSCASELDAVRPAWRSERVGLVLGTSSGGMRAAEQAFSAFASGLCVPDTEAPTYFGPAARAARALGIALDPAVVVLGACASASLAIGLAMRCLARGSCDLVFAGGFDEVTVFVAAGFEVLRATTGAPPPRPFRAGRDGMALGDGAAVLALARAPTATAHAYLWGFGAASDASHLTAPDAAGVGLARAACAALGEAGRPAIDLVSAHATATPLNDAAEFRALSRALDADRAREVVTHPFKAQIGHTLGAGGALEVLVCVDAIRRGVFPPAAGDGAMDVDTPARLLAKGEVGRVDAALKLTSAFGGANAALVVGGHAVPVGACLAPALRRAFVYAPVHVDAEPALETTARRTRLSVERIARGDALVRMALAAVADLEAQCGPLAGAGVVVGTALATLETNSLFAARIRERGPASAEPRRFPYTSPNAVAGECSIAFGLTGPSFSVGGGYHAALEAVACATWLVEAGDADRVVVVAVDDVGPATQALARCAQASGALGRAGERSFASELVAGAVALLVASGGQAIAGCPPRARIGPISLRRSRDAAQDGHSGGLFGHRALLPLMAPGAVGEIACVSPPDLLARVVFETL